VAADLALTVKFEEELKYEQQAAAEQTEEPEFLKAFKAQGIWSVSTCVHQSLEIVLF
jgi:complement component 1 Q subcomponent-binding protein, mitochondrial